MKHRLIRKPEMYRDMREAYFSPGVTATVVIAFLMLVAAYLLREIPASLIDYLSLLHRVRSGSGASPEEIMRAYAAAPGTMLISLSLQVIMLGIVVLYVARAEKRPLSTIGLTRRGLLPRLLQGWLLGTLMLAACVLPLLSQSFVYTGFLPVALAFIPAFLVQAAAEETLFRGFLLSSFTDRLGVLPAALLSAALSACMHFGSADGTAPGLLVLFLLGLCAALLTVRTGSLWAAFGLNAAWRFTAGLFFPVAQGTLLTRYALGTAGADAAAQWSTPGQPGLLPCAALGLLIIAVLLFAGKRRLVVRANADETQRILALRAAKTTLRGLRDDVGKPRVRYALAAARALEGDALQASSLLADVLESGAAPEGLSGFSEDVLRMARLLARGDETEAEHEARVRADETAHTAWKTRKLVREKRLIEYTEWNRRQSKADPAQPHGCFCPMLRREIAQYECAKIVARIRGGEASPYHIDTRLCERCPRHTP